MVLESLDAEVSWAAIVALLRRDGAVIVRDLAPVRLDRRLRGRTSNRRWMRLMKVSARISAARKRSDAAAYCGMPRAAPHSSPTRMVMDVADAILLPSCADYQIGSTTGIEILPGENDQQLHRDDTPYPIQVAGLDLQIGVMWAFNDFTADNGATRVVPGSHRFLPRLAQT